MVLLEKGVFPVVADRESRNPAKNSFFLIVLSGSLLSQTGRGKINARARNSR